MVESAFGTGEEQERRAALAELERHLRQAPNDPLALKVCRRLAADAPTAALRVASLGLELLEVPAGELWLGRDSADRRRLAVDTLLIARTELTQRQWREIMGTEPWREHADVREGGSFPATYVSKADAEEFCRRLSAQEGMKFRLPTAQEWEYACRARSVSAYCYGNAPDALSTYAWYVGNTSATGRRHARIVGGRRPNAWGFSDMHGNVWEWADGEVSDSGECSLCGGSWLHLEVHARSDGRIAKPRDYRSGWIGFRVAADLPHDLAPAGLGSHRRSALELALENGFVRVVAALCAAGASPALLQADGSTALHRLATRPAATPEVQQRDAAKLARVLAAAGAPLDVADALGRTPLQVAAGHGAEAVVEQLLIAGASVDVRSANLAGETALVLAVDANRVAVAASLLAAGADSERSALRADSPAVDGTDVSYSATPPPLVEAAAHGRYDLCRVLLDAGADVDATDPTGATALLRAAECGDAALVRLLLAHDAGAESTDGFGVHPLHAATERGSEPVVELLLETGASIDARDTTGTTPLHLASEAGDVGLVRLLLERGAELDVRQFCGYTPLLLATAASRDETALLLASRGADLSAAQEDGLDAVGLAASNGNRPLVKQLVAKLAGDVNPALRARRLWPSRPTAPVSHPTADLDLEAEMRLVDRVAELVGTAKPGDPRWDSLALLAIGPAGVDRRKIGKEEALAALVRHLEEQGRFAESLSLRQRALNLAEATHGATDTAVAEALEALSATYQRLDRTAESERLLQRALAIHDEDGDRSARVAVRVQLAGIRTEAGLMGAARMLYAEALELSPTERHRAEPLAGLAVLDRRAGRTSEAMSGLRRAIELAERGSASAATMRLELIRWLIADGQAEQAARECELVLRGASALTPELAVAAAMASANISALRGKGTEAVAVYGDLVERITALPAPDDRILAELHGRRARLFDQLGRSDEARASHLERLRALLRTIGRPPSAISLAEPNFAARTLLARALDDAFASTRGELGSPAIARDSAAWVLNVKGRVFEALAEQARLVVEGRSREVRDSAARLAETRREIAEWSLLAAESASSNPIRDSLRRLRWRERTESRELARLLASRVRRDKWVEPGRIAAALEPDEVLLEFERWHAKDGEGPRYGVWILRHGTGAEQPAPIALDLGPAAPADAAIEALRTELRELERAARRRQPLPDDAPFRAALTRLSELLLRPVLPHVQDHASWLVGPAGPLWLVPWSALPLPGGRCVVENHRVATVTSGRAVLRRIPWVEPSAPAVFAYPDYLSDAADLPGPEPRAEAAAARSALEHYVGVPPEMYLGARATEGSFARLRGPRVLLFATHGFFVGGLALDRTAVAMAGGGLRDVYLAPDRRRRRGARTSLGPELNVARMRSHPFLGAGLLLAGASRPDPRPAASDGILTALEVLAVDLRGTELVVLGACETGLGSLSVSAGVGGLRHAFQLAGAENVVASLWKIPGQETAALLTDFFGELERDVAIPEALRRAQLRQMNSHPFMWAAFVLTVG